MKVINPIKKESAFPFLKNIKTQNRRDLAYFIQMPSNPCSGKEAEIAQFILDRSGKGTTCTEDEIIDQFFHEYEPKKAKVVWQKTKHRLLQTFVRYYTMRKLDDHPIRGVLTAQFYEEFGLYNKLKSTIRNQRKRLSDSLDTDKQLYEYLFLEMNVDEQRNTRVWNSSLHEMEKNLDIFYLEEKVRCLLEKTNRQNIINDDTSLPNDAKNVAFLKWIEKRINDIGSTKADIYYKLFKLLNPEETSNKKSLLNEVEKQMQEHLVTLDHVCLVEFYGYRLNYYIKKINHGDSAYAENYLNCLYQMLDNEIGFTNNELPKQVLKNSIVVMLIANDTKGAQELLDRHRQCLSYQNDEGGKILNLIQANIFLCEEKYQEAYDMMHSYRMEDFLHDIDAQLLTLQLDYSLYINEDPSSILYKTKLTKLRTQGQKKISTRKKKIYLTFLDALKKSAQGKELDLSSLKGRIPILKFRWLERMIARDKV